MVDSSPENQMIDEDDEPERPMRASRNGIVPSKLLFNPIAEPTNKFNDTITALEKYSELINS